MEKEKPTCEYLMRLALQGDGRAYDALLKQSVALLRPYLAKYLRSTDEVNDVLQEILLSIHRAKHTYDGDRPFRPWVFAIAKFRLKDYFRRRYSDKLLNAFDISDVENILTQPVTTEGLSYEHIRGEVEQLPSKQATILKLMHEDGYTAKEVGSRIGMKESAVKVAAHRAYKILREKLDRS